MGFPINEDGALDYTAAAPIPTRLTDGAAEYAAPSEAMMEAVNGFVLIDNEAIYLNGADGQLFVGRSYSRHLALQRAKQMVNAIAAFAAQQAAAAVKERDAEIIAALEQQKIVDTNPHALTERMRFYNSVLGDAIGIIRKL